MANVKDDTEAQGSQRLSPFRIALKSFTSQWFLIPQGTGILAVILHQLHYQFNGLNIIADLFWVFTILTLCLFLAIYLVRILVFPKFVAQQISNNVMETACLSSISITFALIIQMIALTLPSSWGSGWGIVAYVMFWINVVMATAACIGIPYVFTKVQGDGVDKVPPSTLLPLIAALTAAACGGVVCRYGQISASLQLPVIIVSYILIGLALPLAVAIDAVFLTRVFDNAFPMEQKVYQLMMLAGPLGQGSFALQILGTVVQRGAFAQYNSSTFLDASTGMSVSASSQLLGIISWGYATFWWGFATIGILHYIITAPKKLLKWDQSLSAWSIIFPWGVYTNAAVQLGVVLNSIAFWYVSTILAVFLVIFWLANAGASVLGIANGKVLGLDKGWRGTYWSSSAEQEKEAAESGGQSAVNGSAANGKKVNEQQNGHAHKAPAGWRNGAHEQDEYTL